MPTSTWHEVRLHAVAVSAGLPPPMLHGVSVLQKSSFVIGSALAGPKLGTASGTCVAVGLALGLALGEVLGEVWGEVPGDVAATPPDDPPRWVRKKPPVANRSTSTTPMIAGTSHAGRSEGPLSDGRRATVGLRAGVGGGATTGAEVGGGGRD